MLLRWLDAHLPTVLAVGAGVALFVLVAQQCGLGGREVVLPVQREPESEAATTRGQRGAGDARSTSESTPAPRTVTIVTLLPKDAIPSIDSPTFVSAAEADAQMEPDEMVIGLSLDGDARAYSLNLLSAHEIVNDVVGGRPIAVTY